MIKSEEALAAEGNYLMTNRIEALHDSFFAIVMTLLIFGLKIPDAYNATSLLRKTLELLPSITVYIVTFISLGIYWIGQHNQFHYIKHSDRILLWLNLFVLLSISLLPFTTAMLARYYAQQLPYLLYSGNLIVIGLFNTLQWTYATHHHRLTDHTINPALVAGVRRRILVGPFIAAIALLASYYDTTASLALYLLVLPYYMLPGKIDRHWHRPARAHKD